MPGDPVGIPGTAKPTAAGFSPKSLNGRRRDVTFDDIATDLGRVAGGEISWNPKPDLDSGKVVRIDHLDLKTTFSHMRDPFAATTAIGIVIHSHVRRGASHPGAGSECGHGRGPD